MHKTYLCITQSVTGTNKKIINRIKTIYVEPTCI
jgi:hypothetical protein